MVVGEQNDFALAEEAKTNKIVGEVDAFAKECAADLAAAKPIVDAALAGAVSRSFPRAATYSTQIVAGLFGIPSVEDRRPLAPSVDGHQRRTID